MCVCVLPPVFECVCMQMSVCIVFHESVVVECDSVICHLNKYSTICILSDLSEKSGWVIK